MQRAFLFTIAFAVLTACATQSGRDTKAQRMTVSDYREKVTITDDELETEVLFSTELAITGHDPWMNTAWNDQFLRAFLSKADGSKVFQVYVILVHQRYDRSHTHAYKANFGVPLASSETRFITVESDCSNRLLGCRHNEHVAFDVPESELRRAVTAGGNEAWKFRVKGREGDYTGGLYVAEIQALLQAVDEYQPIPKQ